MSHSYPGSRRRFSQGWALISALLLMVWGAAAQAIPAWSRLYAEEKTDCAGCHVAGNWQLNKMGRTFLRYGHYLPGDEFRGDLSKYTSFLLKMRNNGGENKTASFENHAFSLYSGGQLGKGFSYFGEIYLHEESGKTSGTSDFGDYGRSKLAEAYLQYTKGTEDQYASVRYGNLQPQILHIHNLGARISGQRPILWTSKGANKGNPYQAFSRQFGVDAAYHFHGLHTSLGVVNGVNGLLDNKGQAATQFNTVDRNDSKDVYLSTDYSFGRLGSNVGLMYYQGKTPVIDATQKTEPLLYTDSFQRAVAVGNLAFERFAVMAAAQWGRDELNAQGEEADGLGFYVQPNVYLRKDTTMFARYERWDPNRDKVDDRVSGFAAGISWVPFEYGRIVLDVTNYGLPDREQYAYTLEANWGF